MRIRSAESHSLLPCGINDGDPVILLQPNAIAGSLQSAAEFARQWIFTHMYYLSFYRRNSMCAVFSQHKVETMQSLKYDAPSSIKLPGVFLVGADLPPACVSPWIHN